MLRLEENSLLYDNNKIGEVKSQMVDKKETHREFATCFEQLPFAEMMRQGVGSLCSEMMKKIMEHQEEGGFHCSEMIQKMMKGCGRLQDEREKSKEEACHGRKE